MSFALLLAAGLFEQSMARLLEERFRDAALSYLVMRVDSVETFAEKWPGAEKPIAPGSLVKPFLLSGATQLPQYECRAGRCWVPRGHGWLDAVNAIAESCNDWFRQFVAAYRVAPLLPDAPADGESLIGLGRDWVVQPQELLRGYARLNASVVLEGMALSARSGTGRLVLADCLVKTGTAACSHEGGGPGDGLAACLFPASKPRYAMLVRVHGTTGANAAKTAGEMVRSFGALR